MARKKPRQGSDQTENQRIRRGFLLGAGLLAATLGTGVAGYRYIEGWPLIDSVYMTVISIATVGYGETRPLSDTGRLFTIALILIGVGILGFLFAEGSAFLAGGGLGAYRRRERMARMLTELRDHTIVCGYGRLGTALVDELLAQEMPFVVIDRDPKVIEKLQGKPNVAVLRGDANEDEVLRHAGIDRATTLVAALNDDASNVFLTLTARVLTKESNPRLVIHGKADDPASLVKLERAGADHTFCPSRVLGHRIAHQILRPAVTELVGLATGKGSVELSIEETLAEKLGPGQQLRQTALWGKSDLLILAVKTADGELLFPPKGDVVLKPGDRVVVLGKSGVLDRVVG